MRSERRQAPHSISTPKRIQAGAIGPVIALLFAFCSPALHAKGPEAKAEKETGVATYYSQRFEGRRTASGQTFRNSELMAAHAFHPFGTLVRVTNLRNGSFVDVKIADRGGFGKRSGNLVIDLSRAAAARLDMLAGGRARVMVEVLSRRGEKTHPAADAPAMVADAPQASERTAVANAALDSAVTGH